MFRSVAVCAVLILIPAISEAQTCRGSTPLGKGSPGIVELPISFTADSFSLGAHVGGGTDRYFGLGGFQVNNYPDLETTTWTASVIFGGQIAANPNRRFIICPMAFVTYEQLQNVANTDVDGYELNWAGGVQVGFIPYQTATVAVVPTLGFFVSHVVVNLNNPNIDLTVGDDFGQVVFGIGLTFGRSGITPTATVPVGSDIGTVFRLTYSYSFGGR